ncbi:MAG: ATP-dependent protease LonB-like Type I [Firmicutes bacterium]|nr:ATP-dependent protease LonB-like Type I [Bacillota bacterium]MDI6705009.1 Lon family ATP-dependent protease [Bacillota bacterium]
MAQNVEQYITEDGNISKLYDKAEISLQIKTLNEMISDCLGQKTYTERLKELEIEGFLELPDISERIFALQRLVLEDDCPAPAPHEYARTMRKLRNKVTEMLAERVVKEQINKELKERIQRKQAQYLAELKLEILKKHSGPENLSTLKKYAKLERLEGKKLNRSMMELLRPTSIDEIVGQQRAIGALLAKIASPYPQHVLIYGPPGVGKTSAARLALEVAKTKDYSPFSDSAGFIEVDGTTLRWDPREIANPLLGSVHDPIYQGSNRELSDTGIPEPKIGLVTQAHGGILFIDEIGEMDPILQNKLLKVLEDKRIEFESIYYDSANKNMPMYIKKLFEEGAPADFILIGATTRQPEDINPAFRSRCTEIFFEPLTPNDIIQIIGNAVKKLGAKIENGCAEIISQYTIEGRKAVNLLADAYNVAINRQNCKPDEVFISCRDVYTVVQTGRLTPYVRPRKRDDRQIGRVMALGVSGYVGSLLEIEAVSFPALQKGNGTIRFNDTAGPMTKDSLFNAAAVIRKISGEIISDYDIHVNCVGGGRVDGPSAGIAIMAAIISAIKQKPVRQDIAVTGEISIRGYVNPVGGIIEKIYGAKQNSMSAVVIPSDNLKDVPSDLTGIEVYAVDRAEEVLQILIDE